MSATSDIEIKRVTLRVTGGACADAMTRQDLRHALQSAVESAATDLPQEADIVLSRLRLRLGCVDLSNREALRRNLTRAMRGAFERVLPRGVSGHGHDGADAPAFAGADALRLLLSTGAVRPDTRQADGLPDIALLLAGPDADGIATVIAANGGARTRFFRLIEAMLCQDMTPAGRAASGTAPARGTNREAVGQTTDAPDPGSLRSIHSPTDATAAGALLTKNGLRSRDEDANAPNQPRRKTGGSHKTPQGSRTADDLRNPPDATDLLLLRALAAQDAAHRDKAPPAGDAEARTPVTPGDVITALAIATAGPGATRRQGAASGAGAAARIADLVEHLRQALGTGAPDRSDLARRLSRRPLATAFLAVLNQHTHDAARAQRLIPATAEPHPATGTVLLTGGAGLVLLGPFLEKFLAALNCAPGASQEDAFRAAHILHRLTGQADAPEHAMLLARILAGLPTGVPLPPPTPPDAEEEMQADRLMRSVNAAWPPLRTSSVAALRQTFIDRTGTLTFRGTHWQLKVPPASADLLLDRLPWGVSTLRLPWMPEPLLTDWPRGRP